MDKEIRLPKTKKNLLVRIIILCEKKKIRLCYSVLFTRGVYYVQYSLFHL